jgi:hypothetical protein
MMGHRLFIAGYPKDVGGANTELWHLAKLFASNDCRVTMLPNSKADDEWRSKLDAVGIDTWDWFVNPQWMPHHELAGSTVVALCNTDFVDNADKFVEIGCKAIFVPCMNWTWPQERKRYRKAKVFDRYVFHTKFQRAQVVPMLRKYGFQDDQGTIIRGAFDSSEFTYAPKEHKDGERFVIGRLSRDATDKFPSDLWDQYAKIPYPTSVRVMGWSKEIEAHCGPPPKWAECIPMGSESTQEFLSSIHALVPGVGCCAENWPRVGLEAFAAGVPVIAEELGGWCEMLTDGLVGTADRMAYEVGRLAYDRQWRMTRITGDNFRLKEIADPVEAWERWDNLLKGLR